MIAGPVFLLCLLLMVAVFLFQYHRRAYNHRHRLEVEDPSCDHLYLAKDKTLQDLIYDLSTSGSGSGQYTGRYNMAVGQTCVSMCCDCVGSDIGLEVVV